MQEEVHVVDIPLGVDEVHAGKVFLRTQRGEVLGMDAHQLEPQIDIVNRKREVAIALKGLRVDVLLDTRLNMRRNHVGYWLGCATRPKATGCAAG